MDIKNAEGNQNNSINSLTFKLPKRRSTRLKTEIFVESFKTDFLDDEYDITKENLDSSDMKFEPLKKKTKLSISSSNNITNEILNSTDPVQNRVLDNVTKNKDQTKRGGKLNINIERMTDRLIKNLTTVIDDKLKVSQQKNENEFEISTSKRRKRHSSVELIVDKVLNDSADQTLLLQGKRTRRSTILLDTPLTNIRKVIKTESSRQSLDVNINGNETVIHDKLKVSQPKNEKEFEISSSKRRKRQARVDLILDKDLNDSADQTLPLRGKRTRRSTILLDTPPTDIRKIIKIESSRQSLNIKVNGNESHENQKTKILDNTVKVIRPKVSLTKNSNNVMQDNKILEQERKLTPAIMKDFSCANKLLEGKVKASPLKRKRNSIKPKIVEPSDETLHDNNANKDVINNNVKIKKSAVQPCKRNRKPKGLNKMEKDTEMSEISKKVLRSNNASNVNNLQEPQTIKKPNNTQSRIQNSIETLDNSFSTKSDDNNKTKNSQPNKRGRSSSSKKSVRICNPTKPYHIKSIKLSKLTKEQLKNVYTRKIPKNCLDGVLDMIDNDDHPVWEDRNISCHPCIHTHWESGLSFTSDQNMKLKYARQFLLRRDWINLSKVLCLFNTTAKNYYPLLSKYAALLLAYTDKEQFSKFVQFLTSITDSSSVLKKCTQISKDNEE